MAGKRRREVRDVSPAVERAFRNAIEAHADALEARDEVVTLLAKRGVDGLRLLDHVLVGEERNGRALERL